MKMLTMLAIAMLCVACSSDEADEAEPTAGEQIANDYSRQIDKARAVEDQVMDQKQRIDEALKEADDN